MMEAQRSSSLCTCGRKMKQQLNENLTMLNDFLEGKPVACLD
jgi:hypothetical protein